MQGFLRPDFWQASMHTLLTSSVQASPALLSVPAVLPAAMGGLSPLHRTTGLGCPDCGSTCSLPRARVHPCGPSLPFRTLLGRRSQADAFFSNLLGYMEIFLIALIVQFFCQFLLVFHENCSTCRCIFDVFVEGGELHILLLCHLDLFTQNTVMKTFQLRIYNGEVIVSSINGVGKTGQSHAKE